MVEVRAELSANVWQVRVEVGQAVAVDDDVVVLESMKMEHEVRAPRAGRIADAGVRAGDQVVPGQVLARYVEER